MKTASFTCSAVDSVEIIVEICLVLQGQVVESCLKTVFKHRLKKQTFPFRSWQYFNMNNEAFVPVCQCYPFFLAGWCCLPRLEHHLSV